LTTIYILQLRNLQDPLQGQGTTAYFFALLAISNQEILVTQIIKSEPAPVPEKVNTFCKYFIMQKIRIYKMKILFFHNFFFYSDI
jgi:hypothetical protein